MVIREALTSRGFQDAVRRFHGDRALSKILRQVAQSLDGGRARGGGQSAAASLAQRLTTYMHLGFNPHSAAKQSASLPVFAARLGFRRLGSICSAPSTARRTALKDSDEYRARYGTGPASGMNAADRAAYDAPDADPLKKVFGDWGLWMTRKTDWIISAWVGQGVYRDLRAKYIDRGMAEAEADRRAISETFTLIEETQQSGRAENLPEMSREHGFLGRSWTSSATSPLQQMQYEIKEFAEWRDLAANGGTKQNIREARNRFMRAVFINHVLVARHHGRHIRALQGRDRRRARLEKGGLLAHPADRRDHGAVQADLLRGRAGRADPARALPAQAALHGSARAGRGRHPLRRQPRLSRARHRDVGHGAHAGRHHAPADNPSR
jgi:hypothetical protein